MAGDMGIKDGAILPPQLLQKIQIGIDFNEAAAAAYSRTSAADGFHASHNIGDTQCGLQPQKFPPIRGTVKIKSRTDVQIPQAIIRCSPGQSKILNLLVIKIGVSIDTKRTRTVERLRKFGCRNFGTAL